MPAKLIRSKHLLTTPVFEVTEEVALDPDGFEIKRAFLTHIGSAVVMPVDSRGRVLLVRQFRLPAQQELWELPAGHIDKGESAIQAARRELAEETGYRAGKVRKLIDFYASPGISQEKMHLFLATDLKAGAASPSDEERIATHWFTTREMDTLIQTGKLIDAKSLIGYLHFKRFRGEK